MQIGADKALAKHNNTDCAKWTSSKVDIEGFFMSFKD